MSEPVANYIMTVRTYKVCMNALNTVCGALRQPIDHTNRLMAEGMLDDEMQRALMMSAIGSLEFEAVSRKIAAQLAVKKEMTKELAGLLADSTLTMAMFAVAQHVIKTKFTNEAMYSFMSNLEGGKQKVDDYVQALDKMCQAQAAFMKEVYGGGHAKG